MTSLETVVSSLDPIQRDTILVLLLREAYEEEDGTINPNKEIPGADFVETFVGITHELVLQALNNENHPVTLLHHALADLVDQCRSYANDDNVDLPDTSQAITALEIAAMKLGLPKRDPQPQDEKA